MSEMQLTEGQAMIVRFLQRIEASHALPDAAEISHRTRHRSSEWAAGKLRSLEAKGLVIKVGSTAINSRTWGLTEAGYAWRASP